jgi:hypothetical protein
VTDRDKEIIWLKDMVRNLLEENKMLNEVVRSMGINAHSSVEDLISAVATYVSEYDRMSEELKRLKGA